MKRNRKKQAATVKPPRCFKGDRWIRMVVCLHDELPVFGSGYRRIDVKARGSKAILREPHQHGQPQRSKVIPWDYWQRLKPKVFMSFASGSDGLTLNDDLVVNL